MVRGFGQRGTLYIPAVDIQGHRLGSYRMTLDKFVDILPHIAPASAQYPDASPDSLNELSSADWLKDPPRQSATGDLVNRIMAQMITIVGGFIAAADLVHPLLNQLRPAMGDFGRVTPLIDARR